LACVAGSVGGESRARRAVGQAIGCECGPALSVMIRRGCTPREKPVERSSDERGDGVGALVGVQLAVGQAGVVIDDGVGILIAPPGALFGCCRVADCGDGVTWSWESGVARRCPTCGRRSGDKRGAPLHVCRGAHGARRTTIAGWVHGAPGYRHIVTDRPKEGTCSSRF
jgi:hypothetical protein